MSIYNFIFLFFLTFNIQSQTKQNLNLPSGNYKLEENEFSQESIDIVIDENSDLYISDNKLNFYSEIYPELKKKIFLNSRGINAVTSEIHLFCDKNVKYRIVDRIKTEIIKTRKFDIVYRTGDSNNSFGIQNFINGYVSDLDYFDSIGKEDVITVLSSTNFQTKILDNNSNYEPNELKKRKKINLLIDFRKDFYILDLKKLELFKKDFSFATLILLPENKFIFKDVEKENNLENIQKIMTKYDVLFLKFSEELLYDDYIEFIKNIELIKNNSELKNLAIIQEISQEIEERLKSIKSVFSIDE